MRRAHVAAAGTNFRIFYHARAVRCAGQMWLLLVRAMSGDAHGFDLSAGRGCPQLSARRVGYRAGLASLRRASGRSQLRRV